MYDVVQNPILKSSLFATPATEADLVARIEALSGPEKALAYEISMLTFNLCHHLVETKILSKEVFAQ